jgi:WD40 repeat protein
MGELQIGECVCAVAAFSACPDLLAIGSDSGALILRDVRADRELTSFQYSDAIMVVRTQNDNLVYSATEGAVFLRDLRSTESQLIVNSPSEIYDFDIASNLIALATLSNDIILTDQRILRKESRSILPAVCSSLSFTEPGFLAAGYFDASLGKWNMQTSEFLSFPEMQTALINPPLVHSVASQSDFVVAGRQNGLSIYKSDTLVAHELFDHGGPVQAVTMLNCIDGGPFSASGSADGSLMILNLEKLEVLDCFEIEGEKIQCLTSSSQFLAVADTSDNGNIGIFRREDFGREDSED